MNSTKKGCRKQIVFRSAKTGRFVTEKVAKRRPATTVKETIKRKVKRINK